jgi:hypothetical protein
MPVTLWVSRWIPENGLRHLAVDQDQVLSQAIEIAHMPLDRRSLVGRQRLTGEPLLAATVEQIGMRAAGDQVRAQDGMDLVRASPGAQSSCFCKSERVAITGRRVAAVTTPQSPSTYRARVGVMPSMFVGEPWLPSRRKQGQNRPQPQESSECRLNCALIS